MKQKIVLLALMICSISIYANDKLVIDIDTSISMAKENNIDLKRAELTLDGKRRAKATAYNVFYPSVSGFLILNRSNTEPAQGSDTNFLLGYEASLNFTPALFNAITLLKKDYEMGVITYEQAEKKIEKTVKELFYNLIILNEQISLLEDNLKNIKSRYDLTKLNYDAGLVSELELLKVQVSYQNFIPELNNLKNLYNSSTMNFKTILGIDLNKTIELSGQIDPEIKKITFEEAYDLAVMNNDQLKMVYKSSELLNAQKKTVFSQGFLPLLTAKYSSSTLLNDPFGSDRFDTDNFLDDMGELSVSMFYSFDSLFPNSAERLSLEEIDRSITDADLQGKALLDGLKLQITNLIATLNNSLEIQEGLELTVLLAKKSLDSTEQAYKSGTSKLLEVESAQNEYKKARLELLTEKYKYINSLLELEDICGEL